MTKYIFITGGVVSSLGKGVLAASLAKLLQARGYKVTVQKLDPYLNVDPGTMNPYEHGEVYVTEDGAETDLDLGHYERFLNQPTSKDNNVTTGQIYETIIRKERAGLYQGKTVQVIPHVTDEIKSRITDLAKKGNYDILIVEIGGTVGDIESLPYIEAIRQLRNELGFENTANIHLTLIPYLKTSDELKTKPTQHSVKTLLSYGVQPDILVCRTAIPLTEEVRKKLALFCNVKEEAIIEARDVKEWIYEVPFNLLKERLDEVVLKRLSLPLGEGPNLSQWEVFLNRLRFPKHEVEVLIVGKYAQLKDAYKSITEALIHAGAANETRVQLKWLLVNDEGEDDPTIFKNKVYEQLADAQGILVAPGFGRRGFLGKLFAIQYAREQKIPFLGICLGMQIACVEFARNVLGLKEANSTEFDPETPHPVVHLMEEQRAITQLGGTMRLGAYPCHIEENTLAYEIYQTPLVYERHRHRYEFNNAYREAFQDAGMRFSGIYKKKNLVEIIELKDHPFFIACQFHPEFKSTVERAHPLFVAFIRAILQHT